MDQHGHKDQQQMIFSMSILPIKLVNFENLSYDTKSMQDLLAEIGSKKFSLYHLSQFFTMAKHTSFHQ